MGFPIGTAFRTELDANARVGADFEGEAGGDARLRAQPFSTPTPTSTPDRPRSGDAHGTSGASDRHLEHDGVAPVELGFGRWSRWVAVAGGFGYFPIAPGTAGSVAGVLLFGAVLAAGAGLSPSGFLTLYAIGIAILTLVGIRAAGRAEVDFGRRDDGRIVIDEVVGQLIGLAPLAVFLSARMPLEPKALGAGGDSFAIFLEVVTAFVLFRLFDVWKPGAVRWAERRFQGGLGVMADDIVAGVHAALGLFLIHTLVFERLFSSSNESLAVGARAGADGVGGLIGGLMGRLIGGLG